LRSAATNQEVGDATGRSGRRPCAVAQTTRQIRANLSVTCGGAQPPGTTSDQPAGPGPIDPTPGPS
jgi:hypothetical protein